MQSFNRTNLKYEVRSKKPKALTSEIIDLINREFPNVSGIVYCLSRYSASKPQIFQYLL